MTIPVSDGGRQARPQSLPRGLTEIAWLDIEGLDIDGLDIAGLDNDGRLWAIDYNKLKLSIGCFYQLTGT